MKDFKTLLKDLDNNIFSPIYFLVGEKEPFFVDLIANKIEQNALNEEEKAFNQSILYGKDVDIEEVLMQAKQYPMMAERRVIIVREAQSLMKSFQKLASYLEQPQPTTVLVFCVKYKKLDGRLSVTKLLKKHAIYFESKPLYDNQVPQWISEILAAFNYTITPKASLMLLEFLGNNLSLIYKELEKLRFVIPPGQKITPELIEENIGISKDFNSFELNKAIAVKDEVKAHQIAAYFDQNPKHHPLPLTIATLNSFFNKLLRYHALKDKSKFAAAKALGVNAYFLEDYAFASKHYNMKKSSRAIAMIREADMRSKGVGANQLTNGDILKELLVKLMR